MFWQKMLSTTMAKASNSKRKKNSDKPLSALSPACKKARKEEVEKYALEVVDARTCGKGQGFKETYGSSVAIIRKAQYLMPSITATMIKSKADRFTKLARKNQPSTPPEQQPLLVGRPKGSTIRSQKDLKAREVKAKILITDRLREATKVTEVTPSVDCSSVPPSQVSIRSCPTNISDLTPADDDEYDPIGRLGLNFHQGAACEVTNDMIRHLKRNGAVHDAFVEKKAEGKAVQARFEDYIGDSRMTAGAIFKSGRVLLGKEILNFRQKKEQDQLDARLAIIKTAALKYQKRFKTYTDLMESGYVATNEKKTIKDLKVWLSVRKKRSDGAMPSVTKKLGELEEKLKGHAVLTLRDYLIDEGKEEDLINQYLKEHTITTQQHHAVDPISQGVEDADVDVPVGEQQGVAWC
jgi:hypothetical protein